MAEQPVKTVLITQSSSNYRRLRAVAMLVVLPLILTSILSGIVYTVYINKEETVIPTNDQQLIVKTVANKSDNYGKTPTVQPTKYPTKTSQWISKKAGYSFSDNNISTPQNSSGGCEANTTTKHQIKQSRQAADGRFLTYNMPYKTITALSTSPLGQRNKRERRVKQQRASMSEKTQQFIYYDKKYPFRSLSNARKIPVILNPEIIKSQVILKNKHPSRLPAIKRPPLSLRSRQNNRKIQQRPQTYLAIFKNILKELQQNNSAKNSERISKVQNSAHLSQPQFNDVVQKILPTTSTIATVRRKQPQTTRQPKSLGYGQPSGSARHFATKEKLQHNLILNNEVYPTAKGKVLDF